VCVCERKREREIGIGRDIVCVCVCVCERERERERERQSREGITPYFKRSYVPNKVCVHGRDVSQVGMPQNFFKIQRD